MRSELLLKEEREPGTEPEEKKRGVLQREGTAFIDSMAADTAR